MAAFVLDGTRVIYNAGQKNASVQVTNASDRTYGGQVWLTNADQPKETVYLVPSPSFFKVSAKGVQTVRILNVNNSLPADRESLFKLNVQEIPPKPDNTADGSAVLSFAMNTQIKLFWRPQSLREGRPEAEKKLTITQHDGQVWLKNPTPYYFAVTGIKRDGKKLTLQERYMSGLTTLPPFSEAATGLAAIDGKVSVDAIDDFGGVKNYAIN
ncbi:fimbrial chaperone [Citrobacter portucalensis]|uniref:fimbrial chaperone n=1 Tax=Citrobacter portucalensis TaxID=1639133 RepID=UPI00226B63C5|nr:fimbrial chaperone [Citrobacter portucalensis]MCX8980852.1 fimbrial chaperone [Citrobacter portucalensis]